MGVHGRAMGVHGRENHEKLICPKTAPEQRSRAIHRLPRLQMTLRIFLVSTQTSNFGVSPHVVLEKRFVQRLVSYIGHRFVHETGPEQRSRRETWANLFQITFHVFSRLQSTPNPNPIQIQIPYISKLPINRPWRPLCYRCGVALKGCEIYDPGFFLCGSRPSGGHGWTIWWWIAL